MELKEYKDLTQEDKWKLGEEHHNNSGKDELAKLYDYLIFFAAIIAVPLAIVGFISGEENNGYLLGIIGCILTAVLIVLYILNKRFKNKRKITRPARVKELADAYGEEELKKWYEEYVKHLKGIPEPRSAAEIALENAVNRMWKAKHGSSSSSSSSSSYSSSSSSSSSSSGGSFYDGKGVYRRQGEGYYDSKGIYRKPGENFFDSKGVLRSSGESYFDGSGDLRSAGESYHDGKGEFRDK